MFNTGDKVIALTSSLKTSGPRRGSTGYVISRVGDQAFLDEIGVVICVIEVMFTRFGFESKRRREKKSFLNIFPIIQGRMTDTKLSEVLKTSVEKLQANKFDEGIWKRVRNDWFPGHPPMIPIGMLVPSYDNSINLLQCNTSEFIAWLNAHLVSQNFGMLISNATAAKHMSGTPINKNALGILHNMMSDRDEKRHRLASMMHHYNGTGADTGRREIIEAIRILTAIGGKRIIESKIKTIRRTIQGGPTLDKQGHMRQTLIFQLLADGAFYRALNEPRGRELRSLGSQEVDRLVSNTNRSADILGAFCSPLLRADGEKEVKEAPVLLCS